MPERRFSQLVEDQIRQIAQTSNITQFGRGSKARALLENIGVEIVSAVKLSKQNTEAIRPSKALDKNLDLVADLFNVQRIRRSKAESAVGDLNVNFSVDSSIGTFAGLSSIPTISVGDRLTTSNPNGDVVYEITGTIGQMSPVNNIHYVGVRAIQPGSFANVGRNSLVVHPYGNADIKLTNQFPIYNGADDETNTQMRFRLFSAVRSLATANDTAVFIAARITPGVGDVKILPRLFGIGTSAIIVRPASGTNVPRSMITAVRARVSTVAPSSARLIITSPDIIGFEFNIIVNYKRSVTANEKSQIAATVASRVSRYFDSLLLGDTVLFTDIADVAIRSHEAIKSVGRDRNTFGRAWVYYSDIPGEYTTRRREELLLGSSLPAFSIQQHALAGLEESIAAPITITHGTEG